MNVHTPHEQEQQENIRHSGTVGPVSQWQVRATSDSGAVMTFGLAAADRDRAVLAALERLPWQPRAFSVDPVPLAPGNGGITFRKHQLQHAEKRDGCRFCAR